MLYRVAIITDLHIKQGQFVNGVNTEQNFYDLVEELKSWNLDHVICAGDLSAKKPFREDCELVKSKLEELKVPYDIICGNHDDPRHISAVFNYDLNDGEVYYTRRIGESNYIFLDTNQGSISDKQCQWLSEELSRNINPYIVMHYPPLDSGIVYIDAKHEFKDTDKILRILTDYKKRINVFCGHCHSERLLQYKNLNVFITPSSIAQVDERDTNFKMYHDYVGYRIIEERNQSMRTFVKYLF